MATRPPTRPDPVIAYSVVIPVHNKQPHLARCLDSVLAQKRNDIEVIAVDDASTDGGRKILERFQSQLPLRILQRSSPGPGGYAARNLAAAHARSDWLAFLDADDAWEPGYLGELDALREAFPEAVIIGTGYRIIDPDRATTHRFTRENHHGGRRWIGLGGFLDSYLHSGGCFQTSATAVHRQALLQAGSFPQDTTRQGGDVDTWLRCMLTGAGGAWSPHAGMRYHRDAVNQVTANPENLLQPHPVALTAAAWLDRVAHPQSRRALRRFGNKKGLKRARDAASAGVYDPSLVMDLHRMSGIYWLHRLLLPLSNRWSRGKRLAR